MSIVCNLVNPRCTRPPWRTWCTQRRWWASACATGWTAPRFSRCAQHLLGHQFSLVFCLAAAAPARTAPVGCPLQQQLKKLKKPLRWRCLQRMFCDGAKGRQKSCMTSCSRGAAEEKLASAGATSARRALAAFHETACIIATVLTPPLTKSDNLRSNPKTSHSYSLPRILITLVMPLPCNRCTWTPRTATRRSTSWRRSARCTGSSPARRSPSSSRSSRTAGPPERAGCMPSAPLGLSSRRRQRCTMKKGLIL